MTHHLATDDTLTARLATRPAQQLAQFIVGLQHAQDPVGEHVRTFLCADDASACAAAIEARLAAFVASADRRAARTRWISATLDYLLDDIEQLVLPHDPVQAFTLLVQFLECDAAAIESATEEDWDTQQGFVRAVALLAQLASSVPTEAREQSATQLLATDHYGLRVGAREALLQSDTQKLSQSPR